MTHVVQDVSEHLTISVNKIMLLQRVQHDGYGAVKQTSQPRVWEPADI